MSVSEKKTSNDHKSFLDDTWFAVLMLVITSILVWIVWRKVPQCLGEGLTPATETGTFGDSFGSVNALFTGLAFAGLVFSILLQQRQIRLQRADYLSQLNEMKGSRESVEEQNRLLAVQNQLLRGQTEVSLLELQANAMQLDAQADELEVRRAGAHAGPIPGNRLNAMRARADKLREKIGELQTHIVQTDRKENG
jgi:hypothetical protein